MTDKTLSKEMGFNSNSHMLNIAKSMLTYNSKTGVFTWNQDMKNGSKKGDVAGSKNHCGYIVICLHGKRILAHRLAYAFYYGCFPDCMIDHINLDKTNNSISNLREATRKDNYGNSDLRKNNTSGKKGVTWDKHRKKWKSQIRNGVSNIFLGRYDSLEEAAKAYDQAAKLYFGEFSLTNKDILR